MADIISDVRASGRAAGARGVSAGNGATVLPMQVAKPVP
jgi:hypothetical protein